jgi:alkylmercury lyase
MPTPSPEEQRAGLVLLGELAKGQPVTVAQFAEALGGPVGAAEAMLNAWPLRPLVYAGEDGRVVGFFGLSTVRTHHRFSINGRTLWAFCAGDSLVLPELLAETAEVESRDPESGQLVRLTISPARVEAVEPNDVVVSFMEPDAVDFTSATRIIATACHFVFFFASRASGERWLAKHPGKLLLSLEEAFALGKRINAQVFARGLERRRAEAA